MRHGLVLSGCLCLLIFGLFVQWLCLGRGAPTGQGGLQEILSFIGLNLGNMMLVGTLASQGVSEGIGWGEALYFRGA